ncbi:YesL family protein [Aquibacillus albus]|uniref:Membrane protein YesL n=1 Tax=Aquibacillus albus TaxID=1168171 RepID=A0ABS2N176_9BACI|nr:DUF624 domain-containing protein [Aquibacillus albus]MBM7571859.1 putative membrane protein YesL [Aquibacillus albus]
MYKASEWVMRLAYLNLLWLLFTVIGVGIIGFFPATVAMFTIVRHWIIGNTDIPILKTYWQSFKGSLVKANLLGFISVIGGVVLYLDYTFIKDINGTLGMVAFLLFLTTSFYYLMIVFFVIPVYVHYDIKLFECLKYAFIIGASYPLRTIYITVASFVIYYLTASFPVLFLFFSGSLLSLLIMRFAYVAFEKIELKNNNKLAKAA